MANHKADITSQFRAGGLLGNSDDRIDLKSIKTVLKALNPDVFTDNSLDLLIAELNLPTSARADVRLSDFLDALLSQQELLDSEGAPSAKDLGMEGEAWRTGRLSITILGASGDLAKKETFPALLDLWAHGYLPRHVAIMGFARSAQTSETFRDYLRPWLLQSNAGQMKVCKNAVEGFLQKVEYFRGAYDNSEDFARLEEMLAAAEIRSFENEPPPKETHRVFYFAIPPFAFIPAAGSIKQAAISSTGFNRLIVEKPFGHDLASAQKMASDLGALFKEEEIYRMDHFLGYEICQNILFVRYGNAFLEPLLNRHHVSCVRVTLKEDFGTEGRGGYFTHYGIIRDVIQNHLLQMLTLVAMEKPSSISETADIRDAKVEVLKAMLPLDPAEAVMGQFVGANGKPGYLEDASIKEEDREKAEYTATFAQIVARIDTERWRGVPFIIRAGKGLDQSKCEVRVQFKVPDGDDQIFKGQPCPRNEVVMRVSPGEAVYMKMNVKSPGLSSVLRQSELDLSYRSRYQGVYCPDAYTRLILAGLRGQQESFVRDDELLWAWQLFSPFLEKLEDAKVLPLPYEFGSRGPAQADEMLSQFGFKYEPGYIWRDAEAN